MQLQGPTPLQEAAQGPSRGGHGWGTYPQGDCATPAGGVQLEGGSPRAVCLEALCLLLFLVPDQEQDLLLGQPGAVGALQLDLCGREGEMPRFGAAAMAEQAWGWAGAGLGAAGAGEPHRERGAPVTVPV